MKNITQWQHFKKNHYLSLSLIFVLGSFWMAYDIEDEVKWISIIVFLIGAVVIPLGNYFSWKKKFK